MENILYFSDVLKKASKQKNEMAIFLEELEKNGLISEEYITYALRYMSHEQFKYIISLIKLFLKS